MDMEDILNLTLPRNDAKAPNVLLPRTLIHAINSEPIER